MTKKYTPGPWRVTEFGEPKEYVGGGVQRDLLVQSMFEEYSPRFICKVDSSHTLEHRAANAILISCAPELLEMLEEISEYAWNHDYNVTPSDLRKCDKLIAKAKGE